MRTCTSWLDRCLWSKTLPRPEATSASALNTSLPSCEILRLLVCIFFLCFIRGLPIWTMFAGRGWRELYRIWRTSKTARRSRWVYISFWFCKHVSCCVLLFFLTFYVSLICLFWVKWCIFDDEFEYYALLEISIKVVFWICNSKLNRIYDYYPLMNLF